MSRSSDETRSLKQENELLHQEVHKLTLNLKNLQKSHSTEIEFLREEHEHEKKEHKAQLAKVHEEYKAREVLKDEKNGALTEEVNGLRDELEGVVQLNEKFRTQVEILKSAKSAGAASSYSDYEGLKESQRTLRVQLVEKEEILTAQTEKISKLDREVGALRGMVGELTELSEGKDSAIKELQGRIKDLEREKEEETGLLQNEVLILKEEVKRLQGLVSKAGVVGGGAGEEGKGGSTAATGVASRGNSLFSEVEERRVKVEGELQRLRELVKRLTAENRTLQLELERGDSHSASITTQLEVISKSEQELAVEIKRDKSETLQLFDSYRDRFEYLRSEYTRKLQQYKSEATHPASASELESLRQDRDSLQLLKITMERENNELKRELKYNKHLRANAEANVKILKAKVDFLKEDNPNNNTSTAAAAVVSKPLDNSNLNDEFNTDSNLNPMVVANLNESVLEPPGTPKRSLITKQNTEQCAQQ